MNTTAVQEESTARLRKLVTCPPFRAPQGLINQAKTMWCEPGQWSVMMREAMRKGVEESLRNRGVLE
jgi:hypothetical protein